MRRLLLLAVVAVSGALLALPGLASAAWNAPQRLGVPVETTGEEFGSPAAALADNGAAIATWQFSGSRAATRRPGRRFGRSVAFPILTGECAGIVAAGPGRALAVGPSTSGGGVRFGAWRLGRRVATRRFSRSTSTCSDVAMRPSGAGVVAYSTAPGSLTVRRRSGSGRLTGPKRLPTGAGVQVDQLDVAIGPRGDVVVAWLDAREDGRRRVMAATRSRQGRWSGPQVLHTDDLTRGDNAVSLVPVRAAAGPSEALVLWPRQEGNRTDYVAALSTGAFGQPLGAPATVSRSLGVPTLDLQLVTDDAGTAFAVWNAVAGPDPSQQQLEVAIRPPGGPVRPPSRIAGYTNEFAVAPAGIGRAVAAWGEGRTVAAAGITGGGAVLETRRVPLAGADTVGEVAAAANRSGGALAVWTSGTYDEETSESTGRVTSMLGRPFAQR